MQPLIDCPACAQLVLTDTPHCPFCGARMAQGSTVYLGLGLTLVLGAATAACTGSKVNNNSGQGTTSDATDTDALTDGPVTTGTTSDGGTVGTTVDPTSSTGSTSTGTDGTDGTDSSTGNTSTGGTSTTSTVSSDSWDSDAAAASYAGPDEQDSTDKL